MRNLLAQCVCMMLLVCVTQTFGEVYKLQVGERQRVILKEQAGLASRTYSLHALNALSYYEVRISYPATMPTDFVLSFVCSNGKLPIDKRRRSNTGRTLLNTEKLMFTTDEDGMIVGHACDVSAKEKSTIPNVHVSATGTGIKSGLEAPTLDVTFDIVLEELLYGVPYGVIGIGFSYACIMSVLLITALVVWQSASTACNSFRGRQETKQTTLKSLIGDSDNARRIRTFIIANEATLVLPQNVTLETLEMSEAFMQAHIIIANRNNEHQFVTMNGILGQFDEKRETLMVVAGEDVSGLSSTGDAVDNNNGSVNVPHVFEARKSEWENFSAPKSEKPILVLRETLVEMEVEGRGTVVPVILTSFPIHYENCGWEVLSSDATWKEAVERQKNVSRKSSGEDMSLNNESLLVSKRTSKLSNVLSAPFALLTGGGGPTSPRSNSNTDTTTSTEANGVGTTETAPRSRGKLDFFTNMVSRKRGETNNAKSAPASPGAAHLELNSSGNNVATVVTENGVNGAEVVHIGAPVPEESNTVDVAAQFLVKIKHPKAAEILKRMKQFVREFTDRASAGKLIAKKRRVYVRNFVNDTESRIRENVLWKQADDVELEAASEGVEKFIMSNLHSYVFKPDESPHKEKNETLKKRIESLQWIEPRHLDIPQEVVNNVGISQATAEFVKMNEYKTPRDKLVCILNGCKVVYSLLSASMAGADDFLPLLIFTVIKANPPNLYTNISYISDYRNQARMMSESGYYFTQVQSVMSFIDMVDHSRLSITEEEWNANMEKNQKQQEAMVSLIVHEPPSLTTTHKSSDIDIVPLNNAPTSTTIVSNNNASLIDLDSTPTTPLKSAPPLSSSSSSRVEQVLRNEPAKSYLGDDIRFLTINASELTTNDIDSLLSVFKRIAVDHFAPNTQQSTIDALFAGLSPREDVT